MNMGLQRVANYTGFFRDPFVWDTLKEKIIPNLGHIYSRPIIKVKVLVVGCSSGCEAYSIEIILKEMNLDYQIDAIDIDDFRIVEAKQGLFNLNQMVFVSNERRDKFFKKKGNYFGLAYKSKVNFVVRDVFDFLGKGYSIDTDECLKFKHYYDIIFCRNVLHYFDDKTALRLVNAFAHNVSLNSFVVFGTDDKIPNHPDLSLVEVSEKIYRMYGKPIIGYPDLPYSVANVFWYSNKIYEEVPAEMDFGTKVLGIGGTGILSLRALEAIGKNQDTSYIGVDTNICPLTINCEGPWICIGMSIVSGLGCGGDVNIAGEVVSKCFHELTNFIHIEKTKRLIVLTGGGGSTGSEVTKELAIQSKKLGIPIAVVITKPFSQEHPKRRELFENNIETIKKNSNLTLIVDLFKTKKEEREYDIFRFIPCVMATVTKIIENIDYSKMHTNSTIILANDKERAFFKINDKTYWIK
jgi:chemotaxis protein methyltransferase CheR